MVTSSHGAMAMVMAVMAKAMSKSVVQPFVTVRGHNFVMTSGNWQSVS